LQKRKKKMYNCDKEKRLKNKSMTASIKNVICKETVSGHC
jgi:hypothetical protein